MRKNIIWLASYPKSGNTWFRVILSNLQSPNKNPVEINQLDRSPIASSRYIFDQITGTNSSDLTSWEVDNLRPLVYKKLAADSTQDIFLKVHDKWQKNELGESYFSYEITKGVIYFIRNPLDVAASLAYHNNSTVSDSIKSINSNTNCLCKNPKKLHSQLLQNLSDWSSHVKSWTEESNLPVHVIRYEDLHTNPYETISKALSFLEIRFEKSNILNSIRNSSFENLQRQELSSGFNEKPISAKLFFREGKSGNWNKYLTNDNVFQIVNSHSAMMKKYCYPTQFP